MNGHHREPGLEQSDGAVLGAVGSLVVMMVAILLTAVRDQLGPTNIALVLCIVVVSAAAIGGRYTGVITGFVGALSFDFWHVRPYGTLRIDRAQDIEAVVLLMVVGAIVGELNALRHRSRIDRSEIDVLLDDVLTVIHLGASGAPVERVWDQVRSQLLTMLSLVDCRFETPEEVTRPLPHIDRSGGLARSRFQRFLGRGFELPPEGAEISVGHGGVAFGRIVLIPGDGHGATLKERRVAVALAEQYAIAMFDDRSRR